MTSSVYLQRTLKCAHQIFIASAAAKKKITLDKMNYFRICTRIENKIELACAGVDTVATIVVALLIWHPLATTLLRCRLPLLINNSYKHAPRCDYNNLQARIGNVFSSTSIRIIDLGSRHEYHALLPIG